MVGSMEQFQMKSMEVRSFLRHNKGNPNIPKASRHWLWSGANANANEDNRITKEWYAGKRFHRGKYTTI